MPPAAAAVIGTVTPHRTDSTRRLRHGLVWANRPALRGPNRNGPLSSLTAAGAKNLGAKRARVAAALKASAPSAPIANPSRASAGRRADLASSRTAITGTTIRIIAAVGMAMPVRNSCRRARPADIGNP